jgi:hypothetical protein
MCQELPHGCAKFVTIPSRSTTSTSRDGGAHWDFVDSMRAYILTEPQDCPTPCAMSLVATDDGGASWSPPNLPAGS